MSRRSASPERYELMRQKAEAMIQRDNPSKRAAQNAKALKIVAWLNGSGALAADPDLIALPTMDDEWWRSVAQSAGVQHRTPPSAETRAIVIATLRAERKARQQNRDGVDPFAGLPKRRSK